jgi:hypothetical protein
MSKGNYYKHSTEKGREFQQRLQQILKSPWYRQSYSTFIRKLTFENFHLQQCLIVPETDFQPVCMCVMKRVVIINKTKQDVFVFITETDDFITETDIQRNHAQCTDAYTEWGRIRRRSECVYV